MAGDGELSIRTNLDAVRLRWVGGQVSVDDQAGRGAATLPQWALAQMLYGYRGASSLANAGVLRGPRDAVAMLNTLLPPGPTMFHYVDQF